MIVGEEKINIESSQPKRRTCTLCETKLVSLVKIHYFDTLGKGEGARVCTKKDCMRYTDLTKIVTWMRM